MKNPRESARTFAAALGKHLGDGLESVLLYGSVARGEAVPGVSDTNVLVLLERIDAGVLKRGSALARRWVRAGNTVPLLMTWAGWRRAADAFAIELSDMLDAHEVLHGRDPLEGLVVERLALRLQAERELRGKVLQLREGLLLAAEDTADVGRLLLTALPSFTTYLRAALRLTGGRVSLDSAEVIRDAAPLVGAPGDAFLRVWNARTGRTAIRADVDDPLVAGYYTLAERTAEFVDTLPEAVNE